MVASRLARKKVDQLGYASFRFGLLHVRSLPTSKSEDRSLQEGCLGGRPAGCRGGQSVSGLHRRTRDSRNPSHAFVHIYIGLSMFITRLALAMAPRY